MYGDVRRLLAKGARDRLTRIKQNDLDDLMSFRLIGQNRIWCVRDRDHRFPARTGPGQFRGPAARLRAADQSNRKRSKATKAQPRTEDGTKLASGGATTCGTTSFPKAEQGKRTDLLKNSTGLGFDKAYLSRARTVLKHAPDLAGNVLNGSDGAPHNASPFVDFRMRQSSPIT